MGNFTAGAGDFFEKVRELRENVGRGVLRGTVEMDQVYAWNQHEARWINFMGRDGPKAIREYHGGGGPKFLGGPLLADAHGFVQTLADRLFEPKGVVSAMIDDVEKLSDAAAGAAPVEFGDLRESTHPRVEDDGAVVYDRPPQIGRLSESELDAKNKARQSGRYERTYLPTKHPLHGTLGNVGEDHPKPAPSIDSRSRVHR